MVSAKRETRALTVADIYDANDEERRLLFITSALYRRILADMHLLVTEAFDLDPATFRLPDSATTALLGEAADRVVGISSVTREAIAAKLQEGQDAGLTSKEIEDSIAHLFDITWAGRAETITRTEIGEAQRLSAIDRYKASGLVDRVRIRDGEDDEPCRSRNGTVVPLDDAPQLAHPRCTLTISPVLIGDPA